MILCIQHIKIQNGETTITKHESNRRKLDRENNRHKTFNGVINKSIAQCKNWKTFQTYQNSQATFDEAFQERLLFNEDAAWEPFRRPMEAAIFFLFFFFCFHFVLLWKKSKGQSVGDLAENSAPWNSLAISRIANARKRQTGGHLLLFSLVRFIFYIIDSVIDGRSCIH